MNYVREWKGWSRIERAINSIKRRRGVYKITLLSLLSVATLYAEPSPVVQYLMKEHVTMFDWGILRTEIEMEESINSHAPGSQMGTLWREYQIGADVSAGYNFNQNQIRIAAFIAPARWVNRAGFTEGLARDICKQTIEKCASTRESTQMASHLLS